MCDAILYGEFTTAFKGYPVYVYKVVVSMMSTLWFAEETM